MFTSRSEYRLSHRQDNADLRLTQKALTFGETFGSKTLRGPMRGHVVTSDDRIGKFEYRKFEIDRALGVLNDVVLPRATWNSYGGPFVMKFGEYCMTRGAACDDDDDDLFIYLFVDVCNRVGIHACTIMYDDECSHFLFYSLLTGTRYIYTMLQISQSAMTRL